MKDISSLKGNLLCGKGGIRTLGTGKSTHAFQASLFNHSSTFPYYPNGVKTTVLLAERGRFELPVNYKPTTVFETAAFNHSAISPYFLQFQNKQITNVDILQNITKENVLFVLFVDSDF